MALFGMLFMQLAIASYACPGLLSGGDTEAAAADEASMMAIPDCDQPDEAKPALCHAHCQDTKSSLDRPEVPVVSPAVAIVSAILAPLEPFAASAPPSAEPPSLLHRITAPPIAIRHCCFRI